MLLGQLTLDVGRFRDVLKVAPPAALRRAEDRPARPRPAPPALARPLAQPSPRFAGRGDGSDAPSPRGEVGGWQAA